MEKVLAYNDFPNHTEKQRDLLNLEPLYRQKLVLTLSQRLKSKT